MHVARIFAAFSIGLLTLCRAIAAPPAPLLATVWPEDAAADLNELIAVFAEVHPNAFWARSEEDVRNDAATIASEAPMPLLEFFRRAQLLVVSLDDPHSWVNVPGWKTHRESGGPVMPMDLKFSGSGAVVVFSPDEASLPRGARVTSINGEQVADLISRFVPLSGAADDPYATENLSLMFRRYCWAFEGWGESSEVAFVRADGGDGRATLGGVSAEEYARLKKQAVVMDAEPYSFSITADGFGLIEFRSCVEPERMLKFIDEVFARLKNEPIPGLVIDARDNTGGGDDVWTPLVQHFADKPFSAYAGSRFRVSQRVKDQKGQEEFTNGYGDKAWEAPAGAWLEYRIESDDLTPPTDSPLRYTGPVCLLAGPRTFSSGMSFVAAVKAYGLGTVIGQETGGRVKGFGQWVEFTLPRTRMTIAVSTKEFVGAIDVPYRRGVPPDIRVAEDPAAIRYSARDAAYQTALRVLREKIGVAGRVR